MGGVKEGICFSVKKIKRLYPLHVLTLAVLMLYPLVYGMVKQHAIMDIIHEIVNRDSILNILLMQAWVPQVYFTWNTPSWYLSASLIIYAFFPTICKKINQYRGIRVSIVISITIFLLQLTIALLANLMFQQKFVHWITYIIPLYRLGDFWIGCNIAYIFVNRKHEFKSAATSLCEMITIALAIIAQMIHSLKIGFLGSECIRYTLLFVPISCTLIFVLSLQKGILSKLCMSKVLVWLGDLSPYAFLVHFVVIRYLQNTYFFFFRRNISHWELLMTAFPVTCLCSWGIMEIEKRWCRHI